MGKTISEKIIARVSGQKEVHVGETVWITPDLIGAYEFSALDTTPDLQVFGVDKLKYPEKVAIFMDHQSPTRNLDDANLHVRTRTWCQKYGVEYYEGMGIGHQAVIDLGLIRPGMFFAHHDAQVMGVGGIGALAIGTLPIWELYTRGKTWLKVPETYQFNISGRLPMATMARDIMHMIVGEIGPDGAAYKIAEFSGPTVSEMSIDGRITMCNIINHAGAKTGIVNPDEKTYEYVRSVTSETFESVSSDLDAKYAKTFDFDVSKLEPYVVAPSELHNCKPLREVEGTHIDVGYIGSCAGGRLEDIRAAARILKGKQINRNVKLYVVPSSRRIMQIAGKESLLQILIDAGASVFPPTCDFCGGFLGHLAPGETAITTGTLNLEGRMGSEKSSIYLANAFSVACAALEGKIVDPRKYA